MFSFELVLSLTVALFAVSPSFVVLVAFRVGLVVFVANLRFFKLLDVFVADKTLEGSVIHVDEHPS